MTPEEAEATARVLAVCRRLRGPQGCPWDREQTLDTMTPYLLEEAVESIEAIGSGDAEHMIEELGDLYFLVLFLLELTGERHGLGLATALDRAADKLIRRHPHVYGGETVANGAQAFQQWQAIKRAEKQRSAEPASLIGETPRTLPALLGAFRTQEKAAAVGFDWPDTGGPLAKIHEELGEVESALMGPSEQTAREVGDLLFAVVNLSRHLKIDPERELRSATSRFRSRFLHIERRLAESGRVPSDSDLAEMDRLWNEAKRIEATSPMEPSDDRDPA